MNTEREKKINAIFNYINVFSENTHSETDNYEYAVKEYVKLLKASGNFKSFLNWCFYDTRKIDEDKVKELMDFGKTPFNHEIINSLIKLEKLYFPGIIKPLVRELYKKISTEDISIILNLGSGGMEIERQLINSFIKNNNKKHIMFIGLDLSNDSHNIAESNLSELNQYIDIYRQENLEYDLLEKCKNKSVKLYTIILCSNDMFSLDREINGYRFDLIFSSFFKHHLNNADKIKLDELLLKLTDSILEYDGFRSMFNLITQSIFAWKNPVFLNDTALSNIRYPKKQLLNNTDEGWKVKYFYRGMYLKEYYREAKIKQNFNHLEH